MSWSQPVVAAVLSPQERARVEAAGDGTFSLIHHGSLREALRVVRERPVDALLVSLNHCGDEAPLLLEQFGRAFPAVPAVALMSREEQHDPNTLLRLGAYGVRQVIDVSVAAGWRRLREVLGAPVADRATAILTPILDHLPSLTPPGRAFWEELVRGGPEMPTILTLSRRLAVPPTSLTSRFVRLGLPSPKDHLVGVRLCHAARLFDEGEHGIADVAYRLAFASPQSFARHLRLVLGITPGEFRIRYPFSMMMERFLDGIVRPHRARWRGFRPLTPGVNPAGPRRPPSEWR